MNLKVAQQYVGEFGKLAKTNNTMIIPADLAGMGGMVATATEIINTAMHKGRKGNCKTAEPAQPAQADFKME
jgi:hypothetical protein